MRASSIAANGRIGVVGAVSLSSSGRISRLVGLLISSFINAFILGKRKVKVFRAIAEMDRIFSGDTGMTL